MVDAEDLNRPHRTRRKHQEILARRQRQRRKQRRRRVTRIRTWKTLNSIQFWTRTLIGFVCVSAVVFWAKFAIVYHIPTYVQKGHLYGINAYAAEKAWWFGPVVFDLGSYSTRADPIVMTLDPTTGLLGSLGQYQSILESPKMIWIARSVSTRH